MVILRADGSIYLNNTGKSYFLTIKKYGFNMK